MYRRQPKGDENTGAVSKYERVDQNGTKHRFQANFDNTRQLVDTTRLHDIQLST